MTDIIGYLTNSTLYTSSLCLRTDNFDPEKLLKMQELLKSVFQIKNQNTTEILNVIQLYKTTKQHLSEAENFVKNFKKLKPKRQASNTKHSAINSSNPVLQLSNPQEVSLSLGRGMLILREITKSYLSMDILKASMHFSDNINKRIIAKNPDDNVKNFWGNSKTHIIERFINELTILNKYAGTVQNKDVLTMKKTLDEAVKVK